MNVQWHGHGHRLDVELAIALEAAWRRLVAARSPRQLESAILFNLRLWRAVRALAEMRPDLGDGDGLVDTADHIATMLVIDASPCPDPRDVAFVAGRNLSLARGLAGEVAAARIGAELMAEWAATSTAVFDEWLLQRIRRLTLCTTPFERDSFSPV